MKRNGYINAVLVVMAAGTWFLVQGGSPADSRSAVAAQTPGHADVRKLQEERLATLRQARDLAERQLDGGTGSFEAIERLDQSLVDAELALATTPAQRAAALTSAVSSATKLEAVTKKRADAGLATTLETLEARAHRLSLEIKLGEVGADEGRH